MYRRIRRLAFAALAVGPVLAVADTVVFVSNGSAQEAGKAKSPPARAKKAEPAAQVQPPKAAMPDAEKIVMLLRTTLLTLNDALDTGNFTVLRDVAAPGFRNANSAARLSAIFGNLMAQRVDLMAVAILAPQLTEKPVLDEKAGMVRIKGYFPAPPMQINFEMIYQAVDGRWRLFGLSVQPTASAPTASAAPPTGR